jgi:hypothetical protein
VEPEDELTIPRAAMNKMIKEILPNIRVANEVPVHTLIAQAAYRNGFLYLYKRSMICAPARVVDPH